MLIIGKDIKVDIFIMTSQWYCPVRY